MSDERVPALGPEGLKRLIALRREAVESVTARFYETFSTVLAKFGERGREATREDLGYHLDFLRPVVEFGFLQPFVDYLRWLSGVLASRGVPADLLPLSLLWLEEFFAAHLPPEDAATVTTCLRVAGAALQEPRPPEPLYLTGMPCPWEECGDFEHSLLLGNHREAMRIFQKSLETRQDYVGSAIHIVQPALYRIGQKWQDNEVSVAQEHLATAIANGILARGFSLAEARPPVDRKVVLACAEGNQHSLGLQIVADAFELHGWEVLNLGANTPTDSLVRLVRETQPNLVGLSASLPHHFSVVKAFIATLHVEMGDHCPPVMLGGLAINQCQPLVNVLGADSSAIDASSAIANLRIPA